MDDELLHLADINEAPEHPEVKRVRAIARLILPLLVDEDAGEINFHTLTVNDHGVPYDRLTWYRHVDERGVCYRLMLRVSAWRLHAGIIPAGGIMAVGLQASTLSDALTDILLEAQSLLICPGCNYISACKNLSGGLCASCLVRSALSQREELCSICLETTKYFVTTICDHHFHPHCLITAKKKWNREGDYFPCPNCRQELPPQD